MKSRNILLKVAMWLVWASFASGTISFSLFLFDRSTPEVFSWAGLLYALIHFVIAISLRFLWLPRTTSKLGFLIGYIVGVMLSQSLLLSGAFIFREMGALYTVLSFIAIAAYIPIRLKPRAVTGN